MKNPLILLLILASIFSVSLPANSHEPPRKVFGKTVQDCMRRLRNREVYCIEKYGRGELGEKIFGGDDYPTSSRERRRLRKNNGRSVKITCDLFPNGDIVCPVD